MDWINRILQLNLTEWKKIQIEKRIHKDYDSCVQNVENYVIKLFCEIIISCLLYDVRKCWVGKRMQKV